MRYLFLLKAAASSAPPPAEALEAMTRLDRQAAGVLLDTAGFLPSVEAGTQELVSYALYEVRSREDAVEWARRLLALHQDMWEGWEGEVEVRRVTKPWTWPPEPGLPAVGASGDKILI